jgi:O-antigen ligase
MVVGGILFVTLPSFISQKTYERTYGLLSWSFVTSAIAQAERAIKSDWQTGDWTAETGTESLEEGDVTSLVRIQLWVYATKRFLASPLFGMGWGRFNDRNIHLIDAPPFLSVAARGGQVISPETAHNSYFHLAAESGIIGLVMYLSLWGIIYYRCQRAIQLMKSIDELRAFFIAAQALIVFILTCALTGHALGSPSVMLPTMVILGVAVSFLRGNLYRAENVRLVPMARSA